MLLIGQHCCPNWWSERARPDDPAKTRGGQPPRARARRTAAQSSQLPDTGTKVASKTKSPPAGARSFLKLRWR
jgi:hypothetical protein